MGANLSRCWGPPAHCEGAKVATGRECLVSIHTFHVKLQVPRSSPPRRSCSSSLFSLLAPSRGSLASLSSCLGSSFPPPYPVSHSMTRGSHTRPACRSRCSVTVTVTAHASYARDCIHISGFSREDSESRRVSSTDGVQNYTCNDRVFPESDRAFSESDRSFPESARSNSRKRTV